MGSVSLDNLGDTLSVNQEYLYRDIFLDLQEESIISDRNLHKKKTAIDVRSSIDEGAVLNSINNIFNTIPGEKILTPQFGLNLAKYLFQPINNNTTSQIRREIITGLSIWEPRVTLRQLSVTPNIEQHEYNITLVLTIPSLNNFTSDYRASLTQNGFMIS
jgi:phage baseplate assembly protein W